MHSMTSRTNGNTKFNPTTGSLNHSRRHALGCKNRNICLSPVRAKQSFDGGSDEMRETVKRLTKLFYFDKQQGCSTRTQTPQPTTSESACGLHINNLPLWRTEWSVLPGCQEFLHVLAPHYVHMFEAIFSKPRPWQFGHLYLPGGSKNLGSPNYQLTSGSQAPLVGVLVQVTRAVRLRDGKFLILATCCARFKVVQCVQELPYSIADVELLEDHEVLESFNQQALAAVMQSAGDDVSISAVMAAGSAATRDIAAAVAWAWLKGYELTVAKQQEWPGPGPREGETDLETHLLVQELMAHGVSEVLPLPDGVVIGRCDLRQVAAAAATALQQAVASAAQYVQQPRSQDATATAAEWEASTTTSSSSSTSGLLAVPLKSYEGSSSIVSLNTTVERGINLLAQGAEYTELASSSAASSSITDVLMLEAAVWAQLDTLVALASRVKGNRHTLPFGLLQLRPPPVQPFMSGIMRSAGTDTPASAISGNEVGAGTSDVVGAAADSNAASSSISSRDGNDMYEGSWMDGLQPPAAAEVVCDEAEDGTVSCTSNSSSSSTASSRSLQETDTSAQQQQQPPDEAHNTTMIGRNSSSRGIDDPQLQQLAAASKYAYAASDGCDAHADPLWPPLRRAARLSWAVACVVGQMEQDKGELRQALLEATSIAQRLRFVSAVLSKHVKVLAAVAAVKGVQD